MTSGAHEPFAEHRPAAIPGDRKFGLTLGPLFLAFAGVRWFLGHAGLLTSLMAGAGLGLLIVGALAPWLLGPFNRAWMKVGSLMSEIVNPIVMLLMFALVFTPVAIVMRWFGRDVLALRPTGGSTSYWSARQPTEAAPERLQRQF